MCVWIMVYLRQSLMVSYPARTTLNDGLDSFLRFVLFFFFVVRCLTIFYSVGGGNDVATSPSWYSFHIQWIMRKTRYWARDSVDHLSGNARALLSVLYFSVASEKTVSAQNMIIINYYRRLCTWKHWACMMWDKRVMTHIKMEKATWDFFLHFFAFESTLCGNTSWR